MEKCICIHGHFYQPPRENPWLEEVEYQDSAYPYHDWNERITAECYAPNTASRIVSPEGKVLVIGNNYAKISYNFGPTLLSWLERHAKDIYDAVIEADRLSRHRFSGHGSAMAQAYNHLIMPLANARDRETQVIWGIKDFQKRFQRYPEGMWLPETAVNTDTLEVLSQHGIKFTVLSPYQAKAVRKAGENAWSDVNGGRVDPKRPYLCRLPSGRSLTLFFYDGPISRDIAFGSLLNRGEVFAARLMSAFTNNSEPQLVTIATDGETYGHHHQYGDMALAYCLHHIADNRLAALTNYGEYLEKCPPSWEAQINENTSWSCFHGIERWRNNCGCNSGMHPGWNQQWRRPLREALDWLRDSLVPVFEKEAARYFASPWEARNDFIDVILDRSQANMNRFLAAHAGRELSRDERVRAIKLLEMQRNALLMYTSCGWFFDEVSGIESVQVLQYACRAIQLSEELTGTALEALFMNRLELIPTNLPELINGAKIYSLYAKPAKVDFLRVGAHYAISSLFEDNPRKMDIYCYSADADIYDRKTSGKMQIFVCRTWLTSKITMETKRLSGAVIHLGDQNLNCGVRYFVSNEASDKMHQDITGAFECGNIIEVVKLIERDFGTYIYSLSSLFKDEQRSLLSRIIQPTLDQVTVALQQACDHNCTIIEFFDILHIPVPRDLLTILGYRANVYLEHSFMNGIDIERFGETANDILKWKLDIDRPKIGLMASQWTDRSVEKLSRNSTDITLLNEVVSALKLMNALRLPLNLWKSQNIFYYMDMKLHAEKKMQVAGSMNSAWLQLFHTLGDQLNIETGFQDKTVQHEPELELKGSQ
jgi:alpha-amylase/alpha-mannosidase (GH57 family)